MYSINNQSTIFHHLSKFITIMKEKKNNEELQSRREFFKRAAKGTLPILGAIMLAGTPSIINATVSDVTSCKDCTNGCRGGCKNSCLSACSINCQGSSFNNACNGYCKGLCSAGCTGGCKGQCKGSCNVSSYTV